MPIRGEVPNEKPLRTRTPMIQWQAIEVSEWFLRFTALAIIIALPWYYGSVQWRAQYVLGWAGVAMSGAVVLHCILNFLSRSSDLRVPWLTWLFLACGVFAWVQSSPIFTWQGTELAPPSVQLQRWALGLAEAPNAMQASVFKTLSPKSADGSSSGSEVPCDLKNVPESERTLAWSIEPLHTRGAAMALFLCGLFVWVGRIVFSESNKQLWLYGTLTLTGILIACLGIQGAISYQSLNFLGLKTGGSFATFVSKNSAGGFYNVCIAGCLGLLGWTLLNTRRSSKDIRYRFSEGSSVSKIRGFAEDTLADLNTAQIAAMLCLIGIVVALLVSQCRGAAVSALGAIFIAGSIANAKSHSRGNWIIAIAVVIVFITSMIVFQVDEKAYGRLGSLSEIDLENELRAGRAYIWSIAWKAMSYYGWMGSGLGTFHFAYLPFQKPSSIGWFYHAESTYAQCGVELGYLGLSVLVLGIIALISGLQKAPAIENWGLAFPSKLAGTYLVISQALHSFVDQAIILPALFVPACLLVGSVQGTLHNAQIAPVRKRSRSDAKEPIKATPKKGIAWLRNGIVGIAVAAGSGVAIMSLIDSVKSLAAADAMLDWSKQEDKIPLEKQSPERVKPIAEIWAEIWTRDKEQLKENPIAMSAVADAFIFEYRMNQMRANPPKGAWSQSWSITAPVIFQMALDRTLEERKKNQLIELAGGPEAIEKLEKAAHWYAMAQTKSPLDWRLLWGRSSNHTQCDRSEMARLLPAALTISQHNPQQLLAIINLFRDSFDQSQLDAVLLQAMKTSPWAAINAAKVLAEIRKDGEVAVELFPERSDILQAIASETFTRDTFPKTNELLWKKAAELIAFAPMSTSRREIWLADYSKAFGDLTGEIGHLGQAIKSDRLDLKLHLRLANCLIVSIDKVIESINKDIAPIEKHIGSIEKMERIDENTELESMLEEVRQKKSDVEEQLEKFRSSRGQLQDVVQSLQRLEPKNGEVKAVEDRVLKIEDRISTIEDRVLKLEDRVSNL